ncbi:hypothetical protein ABT174_33830, partial [Streptomyces sparsogenes]|uniref:hypothetical protein n=1 Tax=Streptomyces sparsogenes TaxID=67365 RepID=UPI00332BDAE8
VAASSNLPRQSGQAALKITEVGFLRPARRSGLEGVEPAEHLLGVLVERGHDALVDGAIGERSVALA